MKLLLVLSLLCILHKNVCAYNILAFLPVASKSHYYIGHNLMKGLAKEGNQVTVISPFKEKKPIENYTEVFLEHSWEESRKSNIIFNFTITATNLFNIFFFFSHGKRQFCGFQ